MLIRHWFFTQNDVKDNASWLNIWPSAKQDFAGKIDKAKKLRIRRSKVSLERNVNNAKNKLKTLQQTRNVLFENKKSTAKIDKKISRLRKKQNFYQQQLNSLNA